MKNKTIAHIKIKGNKEALERMMRLRDVLKIAGVEISLEISDSIQRSEKKIVLELSDD